MFEKKNLCNEELCYIYLKYKSYVVYVSNKHIIFWFVLNLKKKISSEFWKIIFKKENLLLNLSEI